MDDQERKNGILEENEAADEEAEEQRSEAFDQPPGNVRDNPHNTRRNHLLTLLWVCLLAAALILLERAGLNRLNGPLDGFMDVAVQHEQSGERQYYTIAENGAYEPAEPFEAEGAEWLITDLYKHEQGRINFLSERRGYRSTLDGAEAELTPEVERILDQIEATETKHWIFRARILCAEEGYFVCVERNVNLWSPYVLYYFSAAQDRLIELATFDGQLPTAVRPAEDFLQRMGG